MSRFLKILIAVVLLINLTLAGVLFYPLPKALEALSPNETVKVYDRHGALLAEVLQGDQGRQTFLSFNQIPETLKQAFLAAEDQRFYEHGGLDFAAILRAIWQDVVAGEVVSGGSTITQQLVRNLVGTGKPRTFGQKLKESVLALRLSRIQSKDSVFELYLNTIYFGGLAYGVEAASQQYFGKSAQNLDLAESAFLAGLPQAPNRYYPFKHFEAAAERQKSVLAAMLKGGAISQAEFDATSEEEIRLSPKKTEKKAPHFVDFVLSQGDTPAPRIETTLDGGLQDRIQNLVDSQITFLRSHNIENAAAVVLDSRTGELLAMVGGVDYFNPSIQGAVNTATSLRQPGSALKPLVYAAAFGKGWTPQTLISDEPVRFDTPEDLPYSPKNFDLEYHGTVTAAQALGQSLNIPAVKALDFVGVPEFLRLAGDFGITSFTENAEHYGLSLALGSGEVTLLELTNAYSTFANGGHRCPVQFLKAVSKLDCPLVLKPEIAAEISTILSDNELRMPEFGEENPLNLGFPVAAKTGTSRNFRDNWTVGYTDDTVVGVWVGNARGELMQGVSGIAGAAPIFAKIMEMLHEQTGTELRIVGRPETSSGVGRIADPIEEPLGFRIITPFANDQFLFDSSKPAETQKIELKASQSATWFVDDAEIGKGESILWPLSVGTHTLRAENDKKESKQVTIVVRK